MAVVVTGGTEGVDYTILTNVAQRTITFTTPGDYGVTFSNSMEVTWFLVGGGGGGGTTSVSSPDHGGGGGGGGDVYSDFLGVLAGSTYGVTVGDGGAGGTSTNNGTNGGNSYFDQQVAAGGNFGQNSTDTNGGDGGTSGSGAAGGVGAYPGTNIDGGDGSLTGGGGGGGRNTQSGSNYSFGGNGADGTNYFTPDYYGGGGAGGAIDKMGNQGLGGGGGFRRNRTFQTNGTPNTGGGGCGWITNYLGRSVGGSGGSGIVILTYTIPEPFPCFKQDSKILTDSGYKMIQHLRKGDMVKTINHGFVPIFAIGKRDIYHPACSERVSYQLYKCSQNEYPEVFEDLVITGCHSILVDNFKEGEKDKTVELLKDIFVTDNKYRLPACIDERAYVYEVQGTYTIYHFALENDNYYMNYGVYANGLLVETCSKRYLTELANMELIE